MKNTRTGKSARLPKAVVDVLGDRLEDGEKAADLEGATDGQSIGDRLARQVAAEPVQLAETLLETEVDPVKRWEQLCAVNRELARLRQADNRAARLALEQRRVDLQTAREGKEVKKKADEERRYGMHGEKRRNSPGESREDLDDCENLERALRGNEVDPKAQFYYFQTCLAKGTPEPVATQKPEAAAFAEVLAAAPEGVKSPEIVVNRAKSSLSGESSRNQQPTSRETPSSSRSNRRSRRGGFRSDKYRRIPDLTKSRVGFID